MHTLLFDDPRLRAQLLPFTHTRAIADIRCGIRTMGERWADAIGGSERAVLTADYLQPLYEAVPDGPVLLINSAVFADSRLCSVVEGLVEAQALRSGEVIIAAALSSAPRWEDLPQTLAGLSAQEYDGDVQILQRPWDIFSAAPRAIEDDFDARTEDTVPAQIAAGVTVIGRKEDVWLEEGATVRPSVVINAESGPVFIARGAEVMEGCLLRGPLFIGEGAVIKMGAKIYGGTVIGPGCKVGGEVQNVVFFANSNKGHDGYLGNAVIGEWCNLGADTNCSNLKNDYSPVKIIDEATGRNTATGLTFCGLLMGDHSKCGINTMFNTGTVVGVSCNIWGSGFPEKFFPSFTWGGPQDGYKEYRLDRALDTARRVFARRAKELSDAEVGVLSHVFETTAPLRAKQTKA